MLTGHERAVLQFSGGKDSRALLELARPHLDRITVLFGETGSVFPHVRRYVEETCRALGARLEIVTPSESVLDYTERVGLPADIVPIENLAEMAPFMREKPKQLLQGYMACCSKMLFEPLTAAIKASAATLVLRGSKKSDARAGVPDGHVADGVEYRSPLWHWGDQDVMDYLDRNGVALPAHYPEVLDSMDCWSCTGHMAHHGVAKLRWMRNNEPDLFRQVSERHRRVQAALADAHQQIAGAYAELETT